MDEAGPPNRRRPGRPRVERNRPPRDRAVGRRPAGPAPEEPAAAAGSDSSAQGRHREGAQGTTTRRRRPIPPATLSITVIIFLVVLALPLQPAVGPIRLPLFRMVLLVMFVPVFLAWISGAAGPIRRADIALLFYCFWAVLSFAVIHGPATAIETGGILTAETMSAYLMGRVFIRSADQFYAMVRVLFFVVVAMLPLALAEAFLGRAFILEYARMAVPNDFVYTTLYMEPRFGLRRVQGPFEHPILFGAFCGAIFALSWFVLGYGRGLVPRLTMTGIVGFTAFLSLSSGALAGLLAQTLLMGWNTVLSHVTNRWKILVQLILAAVVFIEIAAERSTPQIFLAYFAFNRSTAYNRLRIWEFGSASVLNNPVFGIGFNEWERPFWMLSSIDMFWLVPGVRHGLPAMLSLQFVVLAIVIGVIFARGLDARQSAYRLGYVIALTGIYLAGWTVHYWDATYVILMFFLGSGVWFMDAGSEMASDEASETDRRRARRTAGAGMAARDRDEASDAGTSRTGSGGRHGRP